MKSKLDRIISIATLGALLVAIFLLVKRPTPVAQPAPVPAAVNSQSSSGQSLGQKVDEIQPAVTQGQPVQSSQTGGGYSAVAPQPTQNASAPQNAKAEARINSDAVNAAVNKLLGAGGAGLTPDTNVGDAAPTIKDQKVTYDGDTVHGQFLTEIAGKDVWITISGHMGQKDGYATFDPTEFKVGDVDVPISLVNPALQRKLAEERDRLKVAEPAK